MKVKKIRELPTFGLNRGDHVVDMVCMGCGLNVSKKFDVSYSTLYSVVETWKMSGGVITPCEVCDQATYNK